MNEFLGTMEMQHSIKHFTQLAPWPVIVSRLCTVPGVCNADVYHTTTETQVLQSLVSHGVNPALEQVNKTAQQLQLSAELLCKQASQDTLEQAKQDWTKAYVAWRYAAPFMFGPAASLDRYIGQWPVDKVLLDGILRSDDLQHMLENRDVRGYGAAELILFNYPTFQDVTGNHNCEHLQNVTAEISHRSLTAVTEWHEYAKPFTSAGDGKPFLIANDALSLAFTEPLNVLERMLWNRIGIPSGFFKASSRPEMLEAWRSRNTKEAMLASLQGLQIALNSSDNSVINLVATQDGLVSRHDPELAEAIEDNLAEAINGLTDIDGSIYDGLQQDNALLEDLYKQLHQLQQQLVQASLVLELDVRSHDENHVD